VSLIPITATGDAQIERSPKFGFGALSVQGHGSTIKIGPHADLDFGTDDWTLDFWVKVRDADRPHLFCIAAVASGDPDPDNFLTLERVATRGGAVHLRVRYRVAGVDLVTLDSATDAYEALEGTWVHIALVRSTTTLTLYTGGTLYASATAEDSDKVPLEMDLSTWILHIGGAFEDQTFRTADALFDEVRVSTEAEWTTNFTPPAAAYTRTFTEVLRGGHHVRRAVDDILRGSHNVIICGFTEVMRGSHDVLNAYAEVPRGSHHVRTSYVDTLRGSHNVVTRQFAEVLRGNHHVRESFYALVRGTHHVYTIRYAEVLRGSHWTREQYPEVMRGSHEVYEQFAEDLAGRHRVAGIAAGLYELYHGVGGAPDFTAAPAATSTTLPMLSPVISGEDVHEFVVRYRNVYGEVSGNIVSTKIELDGSDNQINVLPSEVEQVSAIAIDDDEIQVKADYIYGQDGDLAADQFAIYTKIGLGSWVFQEAVAMVKSDGIARLVWTSSQAFGTVTVLARVHARRSSDGRESAGIVSNTVSFLIAVPVDPPVPSIGVPI
jgi:hypothetical protein